VLANITGARARICTITKNAEILAYNFGLKWINLVTKCAPFAQSGQKRRAQIGDFLKNKHPCALWCITVRTEAPENSLGCLPKQRKIASLTCRNFPKLLSVNIDFPVRCGL